MDTRLTMSLFGKRILTNEHLQFVSQNLELISEKQDLNNCLHFEVKNKLKTFMLHQCSHNINDA